MFTCHEGRKHTAMHRTVKSFVRHNFHLLYQVSNTALQFQELFEIEKNMIHKKLKYSSYEIFTTWEWDP